MLDGPTTGFRGPNKEQIKDQTRNLTRKLNSGKIAVLVTGVQRRRQHHCPWKRYHPHPDCRRRLKKAIRMDLAVGAGVAVATGVAGAVLAQPLKQGAILKSRLQQRATSRLQRLQQRFKPRLETAAL